MSSPDPCFHCETHAESAAPADTAMNAVAVTDDQAAMCPMCATVWVRRAHKSGPHGTTVYRKDAAMTCPDCKSAVANFFATGKLEHTCTTCGDKLAMCAACN